jgi:Ca2+-transporting ATPase
MILEGENNFVLKDVTGTSFNPTGEVKDFDKTFYQNSFNLQLGLRVCSVCNFSKIRFEEGQYIIQGSPTEGALVVLAEKLRIYDNNFNQRNESDPMAYNYLLRNDYQVLYTLEFDRDRKAMSVLALDKKRNKPVLLTKGACEIVVGQCNSYYTRNGKLNKFTNENKNSINDYVNENFLKKSLRALALCIKEDIPMLKDVDYMDKNTLKAFFKDRDRIRQIEQDLTFLGVVGMLDPPRPEVKSAIETCQEACIRVIMITGDNKNTAESIGVDIGIVDKAELKKCSFTTSEFFKLSEAEQFEKLRHSNNMIFSRSEPRHKMMLVKLLKQLGHITAMTGDGVNDAPALAEAHIGVAMGLSGTDVAKEASHIILADDNFASIVKAVEEGRSIYMNMKAFIRYLISSNIGEVVSIFITSMFGIPEAFTSIQLLWVITYF